MQNNSLNKAEKKARWGLIGAIFGAIAASICCIGPLVLLALGISGAWISNLTILEPYRPIFIGITLLFLGYAFYRVYRKPKEEECEPGSYCANPYSTRINKTALWIVTVIALGLMAFPYIVPTGSNATASVKPVQTREVVLQVDNMTCNGCVLTVRGSLKKLPGVLDAQVTLQPPMAVVKYDPTQTSVEDLIRATTQAGYPSHIQKEQEAQK